MRPTMEKIRLENWTSRPDSPNSLVYDGPRTGIEVFQTLRERLELIGMLLDGPLELDQYWADGRDIPRGANISCNADYDASRGTLLYVYFNWHDPQTHQFVIKHFFSGRTSGQTGADLDRMFLIGSAIMKAVHGDGGESARYPWLNPLDDGLVRTVSLTPKEQQLLVEALTDRREMFIGEMDGTERLLRRMVGSITAYMDKAGGRPIHLSDYDKAALAIRDGELEAFKELYPKAIDRADELLIEAAGRTGEVGRKMTICLLVDVKEVSDAAYLEASKRAVKIGDKQRVEFLMENERDRVETHEELSLLKEKRALLMETQNKDAAAVWRLDHALDLLDTGVSELTEWDEATIRQLVDTVKVISKEKILVILRGGIQIEQDMIQ